MAVRSAGDAGAAMRLAHDLKSAAGTLGMPAVQQAAQALEQACVRSAGDAETDTLAQNVARQLEPVIAGLAALEAAPAASAKAAQT